MALWLGWMGANQAPEGEVFQEGCEKEAAYVIDFILGPKIRDMLD